MLKLFLTTGGNILLIGLAVILIILAIIIIANIKIVSQTNAYVIERLGKYHKTWDTGVHFLVPFIDRIAVDASAIPAIANGSVLVPKKIGIVNLKEQVCDFAPQPVITKDNVTMQIDTVVYYQITDPKAYVYGVSNPIKALDNLTTTTLRNIMGDLDLDGALTSRDVVNTKMRQILDEATDPWGIKVIRVEVKNIMPPKDIRDAMEKQMRAERERREAILLAEGEKRSNILKAEGIKESEILRAEAEKAAEILKAEAKKEALIKEAEGQAESILKINQATAEGLKMIKDVSVDQGVLTLKAYEALGVMADGKATKIIVPSNMQGLAGLAASFKEFVTEKDDTKAE
ncbi:MAG: SPFH/Band 7/PHB domain protein [Bacilli bacterium]|nr:SPFH/Band 7/PHB domain protein [Bacilli bacterium]